MKAVVIHETGGPEVLRLEEVPDPEPGDGEVLIRVHAAGVNPVDWKQRSERGALEHPVILGHEASGTVERSRDDRFAEGDEVFGRALSGAYAELVTTPAGVIAYKPEAVSHEEAATIQVSAQTAWQALLDVAGLEGGQTALIAGAAGGVGHFAVQFAKLAGARVIGIGSARNRDFVLGLGADEYVDYTEQDVSEAVSDVDVAFDIVGGNTTESLVPTVRKGGFLVVIASGPPEEVAKERGFRTALHVTESDPDEMGQIADLIGAGDVRVEIAEVIPIAEVRRAHELSESGHVRGKLVLSVGG
jgi:NADPH:quinone reductase-like Zn-dependent oxidoreductase